MTERLCGVCGKTKPLFDFHKDKTKKYGVSSKCKPCASSLTRQYYQEYKAKYKEGSIEKRIWKRDRELSSKLNQVRNSAQQRSRKSGRIFNITNDDMLSLWHKQQGLCAYTKLPLQVGPNQLTTVSLDRIDNSRGYEFDNIQLVCSIINVMKATMSEREFVTMCCLVSQNNSLEEDL